MPGQRNKIRQAPRIVWDDWEDEFLKRAFPTFRFCFATWEKIQEQLPRRAPGSVKSRLEVLRNRILELRGDRPWTNEELAIIRERAIALNWCSNIVAESLMNNGLLPDRLFHEISRQVFAMKEEEGISDRLRRSRRSNGTRRAWEMTHDEVLIRFLEGRDPKEPLTYETVEELLSDEDAQVVIGDRSHKQLLIRMREIRSDNKEARQPPASPREQYEAFRRSLPWGALSHGQVRMALDMAKTNVAIAQNYVKLCLKNLPPTYHHLAA